MQLVRVHLAVLLVDERQVYARNELDIRSHIGVVIATGDLQTVDSVLVNSLIEEINTNWSVIHCKDTYVPRTDDSAVPVAHQDVVPILQTIRT